MGCYVDELSNRDRPNTARLVGDTDADTIAMAAELGAYISNAGPCGVLYLDLSQRMQAIALGAVRVSGYRLDQIILNQFRLRQGAGQAAAIKEGLIKK